MSTGKIIKTSKQERDRDNLASTPKVTEKKYLQLYNSNSNSYCEINPGGFWDTNLSTKDTMHNSNPIEDDRIKMISLEILQISKRKRTMLLDIGIGNGLIEDRIKTDRNIEIFGIDISHYAIKNAMSKFKGVFIIGSITKIPFNKNKFDIVVASEVLEHVPPSYTFQALTEINRVLKPSGYLLLSVPVNENLKELILMKGINPNQHAREYTKNIIKMELKLSGFIIYKVTELYAFFNMYRTKSFFIKFIRLFTNKVLPRLQVNNLVIFAQKK